MKILEILLLYTEAIMCKTNNYVIPFQENRPGGGVALEVGR
jgi:hypothetical protein